MSNSSQHSPNVIQITQVLAHPYVPRPCNLTYPRFLPSPKDRIQHSAPPGASATSSSTSSSSRHPRATSRTCLFPVCCCLVHTRFLSSPEGKSQHSARSRASAASSSTSSSSRHPPATSRTCLFPVCLSAVVSHPFHLSVRVSEPLWPQFCSLLICIP